MPGATSIEDPTITVRNLLSANWNAANTPTVGTPSISTGWWDKNNSRPQVTVTDRDDAAAYGQTGYTAISSSGPVSETLGEVLVSCWAADGDSNPNPKQVRYELMAEAHRIIRAAFNGTGSLEYLGVIGVRADQSHDGIRMVFRYMVNVRYLYTVTN